MRRRRRGRRRRRRRRRKRRRRRRRRIHKKRRRMREEEVEASVADDDDKGPTDGHDVAAPRRERDVLMLLERDLPRMHPHNQGLTTLVAFCSA